MSAASIRYFVGLNMFCFSFIVARAYKLSDRKAYIYSPNAQKAVQNLIVFARCCDFY